MHPSYDIIMFQSPKTKQPKKFKILGKKNLIHAKRNESDLEYI